MTISAHDAPEGSLTFSGLPFDQLLPSYWNCAGFAERWERFSASRKLISDVPNERNDLPAEWLRKLDAALQWERVAALLDFRNLTIGGLDDFKALESFGCAQLRPFLQDPRLASVVRVQFLAGGFIIEPNTDDCSAGECEEFDSEVACENIANLARHADADNEQDSINLLRDFRLCRDAAPERIRPERILDTLVESVWQSMRQWLILAPSSVELPSPIPSSLPAIDRLQGLENALFNWLRRTASAAPKSSPTQPPRAEFLPVAGLVEALGLPEEKTGAVEGVLKRLYQNNKSCREPIEMRRRDEPAFVYRVAEVWPVLLEALPRWK